MAPHEKKVELQLVAARDLYNYDRHLCAELVGLGVDEQLTISLPNVVLDVGRITIRGDLWGSVLTAVSDLIGNDGKSSFFKETESHCAASLAESINRLAFKDPSEMSAFYSGCADKKADNMVHGNGKIPTLMEAYDYTMKVLKKNSGDGGSSSKMSKDLLQILGYISE